MAAVLAPKLALARAVGALSRLQGGGATSVPGRVLMRLEPSAIGALGSRLARGSVLISATNGKTTTAAMAAGIFEHAGIQLVHNQAGANMAGGIATTLLAAARPRGGIAGELGLFEVDELWLATLVDQLRPRAILLSNLFRDQLDRYGELETIAARWGDAVGRSDARLVLNADDPQIADLGRERSEVVYFGVDDDSLAMPGMAHAADAKHCRRCGAAYVFDAIYLGHLGRYHCGVYNVYNALAAAALASALDVPLASIVAGLSGMRAAFGRAESVTLFLDGASPGPRAPDERRRELRILLVKNPAGANEVLRTLALEPGEHDLLAVLNDKIADGRDVSWIWDADFELLASRIRRVTCSGNRAADLAVRLKYAGVEEARIHVQRDLERALREAADDRPEGGSPLYALPTYTAMLSLRELLVARGEASSAWA
jgi:UDP-N-acetylmuramyl tripeptide synthase